MDWISVTVKWPRVRLDILREQRDAAQRRLTWAVCHNRPWYELSDKGEIVSALEWAVDQAEKAAAVAAEAIAEKHGMPLGDLVDTFSDIPAADVAPVRRGRWIEEDGIQICSECGEEHEWEDYRAPYCDTCGAKMNKEVII